MVSITIASLGRNRARTHWMAAKRCRPSAEPRALVIRSRSRGLDGEAEDDDEEESVTSGKDT